MENKLMGLYTQTEELLEKMTMVLPYLDIAKVDLNDDYLDDVKDLLIELEDYIEYLGETDWEASNDNGIT